MKKINTAAIKGCLLVGVAGMTLAASSAYAQTAGSTAARPAGAAGDAAVPAATPESDNQILVTGSRIMRRDYTATSPIVTVDATLLEESSAVNLEANLNRLPQFTPALTQFVTGDIQANANNTIGASTVSLRSLGANRNLVLIDGRRGTPINGSGVIDINSIPSAAVRRVEVITGGASSTYGADAVGGVVNFILRDDFTGVEIDGQGSMSERGDGFEYTVSALVGAALDDNRGNVLLGVEHYSRDEVLRIDRPWYRDLMTNNLTGGTDIRVTENFIGVTTANRPTQAAYNQVFGSFLPTGTTNVARTTSLYVNRDDTAFLNTSSGADATYVPQLLNYRGNRDGLFRKVGDNGLLAQNYLDQLLSTPQDRWSMFSKGEFEILEGLRFISQANFATTETISRGFYNSMSGAGLAPNIPHNNNIYTGNTALGIASSRLTNGNTHPDYLPGGRYGLNCGPVGGCTNSQVFPVSPDIATLLNQRTDPNGDFSINIIPTAFGLRTTESRTQTYQILAGFEGEIPGTDWSWDVVGAHGSTTSKTDQYGFISVGRWNAIATSPNYGRDFQFTAANVYGATGRCTTGLSPFIDPDGYSADCDLAVTVDMQLENRVSQNYVEANFEGSVIDLPAGEVRAALGAHYRENSLSFHADSSSVEGATFFDTAAGIFPQASTAGSTSVREVYGEVLIPVLAQMPFVEALNLELGYRLSDYDSVGTVHTFKLNGEYAPTQWLRFRGGYQQANRAPNLGELFTARTQTLRASADGDPCSTAITTRPLGYGNYSANIALNPDNAAAVRALCERTMTAEAVGQYYNSPDRIFPTVGFNVPTLETGARQLTEEKAKVFTIGGVISAPTENGWLRGLNLAVDYYNITITDGISLQGADSVFRQCFSEIFNPTFEVNDACRRIRRDDLTGNVELIEVNYANLGRVETSGIDANLTWGLRFDEVGVGIPGRFNLNVNATWVNRFATTPDQFVVPLTDWTGSTGGGDVGTQSGPFEWKLFVRASYAVGPATIGVQWQHYPSLVHSTTLANAGAPTISGVPSYDLFNLNLRYVVNDMFNLRIGVDNLFDKAPPLTAYRLNDVLGDQTLPGGGFNINHDTLGRRFYAGATISF